MKFIKDIKGFLGKYFLFKNDNYFSDKEINYNGLVS